MARMTPAYSAVSAADPASGVRMRRQARLARPTLFLLAPLTAEVLSNSTPALVFLGNPILALLNILLYGCAAMLIRELARRRGLGWASVLWLGAAFGVLEEGVTLNTWVNPSAPQVCTVANGVASGLCDYSRVFDINLIWALSTTAYHAVVSITIPILLVETLFPRQAAHPWLGRLALVACIAGELLAVGVGLAFTFTNGRPHETDSPPLAPYSAELAVIALFITLALCLRPAAGRPLPRRAHPLWALRIFAFFFVPAVVILPLLWKAAQAPFQLALLVEAALALLVVWSVSRWSRREGWGERQMLALASGTLGFFILVWDPFLELAGTIGSNPTRGTLLVALAYLLLLIALTHRTARRWLRDEIERL
jgi:hypothetical protein